MVVPQPLTGQEMRGHGRDQRIHVHFFDEPPTRGWVSSNRVREYQGWLFLVASASVACIHFGAIVCCLLRVSWNFFV